MAFKNLGYIITKAKSTPKFKRGLERAKVFRETRKIIEDLMGFEKHVLNQDVKFEFRGNILTIKCANSYLAQEIRFYQEEIKQKTNREMAGFLIKEIKIKVAR